MQFNDLSSFFSMGGYALYVWLSFGVTLLALLLLLLESYHTKKALLAKARQLVKQDTAQSRKPRSVTIKPAINPAAQGEQS